MMVSAFEVQFSFRLKCLILFNVEADGCPFRVWMSEIGTPGGARRGSRFREWPGLVYRARGLHPITRI